ncbi:MAG: hypothetical protein ABSB79_04255 [Syntrophales bacterium]|jgi:hypothetical protein
MRKRKTTIFYYLLSIILTAVISLYLCNPAILCAGDNMKAASPIKAYMETSAKAGLAETLNISGVDQPAQALP